MTSDHQPVTAIIAGSNKNNDGFFPNRTKLLLHLIYSAQTCILHKHDTWNPDLFDGCLIQSLHLS